MEPKPWEYRVVAYGHTAGEQRTMADHFNGYGRAGWELVSVTPRVGQGVGVGSSNELVAVFKRLASGEVDRTAEPNTVSDGTW
jgi:hypothetical protein